MTTDDETAFYAALLALRPGETMADRLTQYLKPPAWHARAACRGMGPALFYPEGRGSNPKAGLEVCNGCPVATECDDAGHDEAHGTWGGRTEGERRRLVRSQSAPPAA